MTQPNSLSISLTPPAPGMKLQNVHIQPGLAGVQISATWLQAEPRHPEQLPAVPEALSLAAERSANQWIAQKLREWKGGR